MHDHIAPRQDAASVPSDVAVTTVSRRQFLKRSLAATTSASLGVAALAACAANTLSDPPQLADFIYHNGIVLTMVPGQSPAQALAVKDDKIMAVGSEASVLALAGASTKLIDLTGRTVLPGFNDAHCHRIGDRAAAGFASAQDAIAATLAQGWTSISELFVNQQRLNELHALDGTSQLRLRVNAYLPVNYLADKSLGFWFNGLYQPRQALGPRLRVAGAKIFADRGDPRKSYLSQPHSDNPSYLGDVYWTQSELSAMVQQLHSSGWQIATHTCGDAAHDLVLSAYEAALGNVSNSIRRHRIEHCMVLRDDQVVRMLTHQIIASLQINWFTSDWTPEVDATLGPNRVAWAGRWHDMLGAGVAAIGGTDAPWAIRDELNGTPGPALKAIYQAVSRVGEAGTPPTAWMLAQRLTIEQALGLITRDAAYGTFDEGIKGTLAPGKLADLVVLSANPLAVPAGHPEHLLHIDVLLTMIGGKAEYTRPGAESLNP